VPGTVNQGSLYRVGMGGHALALLDRRHGALAGWEDACESHRAIYCTLYCCRARALAS